MKEKNYCATALSKNALGIIMLLGTASNSIAANWTDSGSYDISWFNKNKTEFNISTPEELSGVAYLVNNNFTSFAGVTIYLASDIDLQGKDWIPIGNNSNVFKGDLNGQNHLIDNISLTQSSTGNSVCGLFYKLSESSVCDLRLKGKINDISNSIGLLAPIAYKSDFTNIEACTNVRFTQSSVSTSTNNKYTYDIGGLVGYTESCNFYKVSAETTVNFSFGASSGANLYGNINLNLGGIVGYGDNNVFEKCQTINDIGIDVYGVVTSTYYSSPGTGLIACGGIIGCYKGSNSKIVSCYTKTKRFAAMKHNGTYDAVHFIYGGIAGKCYYSGTIQNCVAKISSYTVLGHDYSWVASWYHTYSDYCGIVYDTPSKFGGCYSNNDVARSVSKVNSDGKGQHGSTSFSSAQMNSQAFVDEANLYSQIMFDESVWGLDAETGELTLLSDAQSGINIVENDNNASVIGIYDINGRRNIESQKGLNIIRYSDGSTKKIMRP